MEKCPAPFRGHIRQPQYDYGIIIGASVLVFRGGERSSRNTRDVCTFRTCEREGADAAQGKERIIIARREK